MQVLVTIDVESNIDVDCCVHASGSLSECRQEESHTG